MFMAYSKNPNLPKVRAEAVRKYFKGWTQEKVARHFGFTQGAVSKWIKRAKETKDYGSHPMPTMSSRPHSHPKALKEEIVGAIIAQRKERHRCAEVVHQELMNKSIVVSLSSVKRTLERNWLLRKRSPWKRWHFTLPRPEAVNLGDLVQVDTIHIVPRNGERFYVYTLIDLATRWVHAKVVKRINTWASLKFVKEAEKLAGFKFKMLQSDHGSEFSQWFTENVGVLGMDHRHSRVRQANDNAHIERFNRSIQEECLDKVPQEFRAYKKAVQDYLDYYNGRRLHMGIGLVTPAQKVAEIIPSY